MSIELGIPHNHLVLCYPLLLLPSIFPSIRVFSNELALRIKWPKYWNFSFSNNPSNEYSGLILFWNIWFDLLAIQGTLKSLLQHHNSKASVLQCSAFFMVQLSHRHYTFVQTHWMSNHGLWVIMRCPCRLISLTDIPLWRGRSVVEEAECRGRRGWQEAYGNPVLPIQSEHKIKP